MVKPGKILWLLGTAVPQFPSCHSISAFITHLEMEGFCVAQICVSACLRGSRFTASVAAVWNFLLTELEVLVTLDSVSQVC